MFHFVGIKNLNFFLNSIKLKINHGVHVKYSFSLYFFLVVMGDVRLDDSGAIVRFSTDPLVATGSVTATQSIRACANITSLPPCDQDRDRNLI